MASSPADRERTASPRAFAIQELIACWDQGYEALTRGDLARVSSLLEFADELLETAADPRRDTPEESELRQRALVVPDKAERVRRFHDRTVSALADMLAPAGLSHPDDLQPHHVSHRISTTEVRQFDQAHRYLNSGDLLAGYELPAYFQENWARAQAGSFDPLVVTSA